MVTYRLARGTGFAPLLGVCVLLLSACGAVLGIEEAEVDESINAPTNAGSAGSLGQGGSGASNPAGGTGGSDGGMDGGGSASFDDAADSNSASDGRALDSPPPQTLCEEYCSSVESHCSGEFEQYTDTATCLAMCVRLPSGIIDDTKKNTVHCRLRQAKLARIEPFTHCTSAGPAGSGVCGTNCDAFCELMMSVCTEASAGRDENGAPSYFTTGSLCVEACLLVPEHPPYTSSLEPDVSRYSGDHVQCRLFHLSAAVQAPDEHCTHAMGRTPCTTE